jgi:hypothetical protein
MSYAGSGGHVQHTNNPTSLSCQNFGILFIFISNFHKNFVKILSSIFFLAALQRQPLQIKHSMCLNERCLRIWFVYVHTV